MSSEQLKKEWEKEFERIFCHSKYDTLLPSQQENLKVFISQLLAKQQEEFVKMITDLQNSDRFDECGDYWQALADIKSKLK